MAPDSASTRIAPSADIPGASGQGRDCPEESEDSSACTGTGTAAAVTVRTRAAQKSSLEISFSLCIIISCFLMGIIFDQDFFCGPGYIC